LHFSTDDHNTNAPLTLNECTGDPFPDSVVIWTRLTPTAAAAPSAVYSVGYTVATDAAFTKVVSRGTVLTSSEVDFTVKTIVGKLAPATKHYYKFTACDGAVTGPTGTTKTAPKADADVDTVAFATVSCSAFETGYFNAYGRIADKADKLDVVLHLGEFCYGISCACTTCCSTDAAYVCCFGCSARHCLALAHTSAAVLAFNDQQAAPTLLAATLCY
jgi:alkaline phosphatase D